MNDLGMELTKSKKKKKIPVYFRISFNACLIFWSNFVTVWDNRLISKSLSVRCLITTKLRNIFISRHNLNKKAILTKHFTAQKMKFSIKDLFSKCDQIGRKLRIWSHLLKKSLMENFIFCAVFYKLLSVLHFWFFAIGSFHLTYILFLVVPFFKKYPVWSYYHRARMLNLDRVYISQFTIFIIHIVCVH